MTRRTALAACLTVAIACSGLGACQLRRPNIPPTRMIDVSIDDTAPGADAPNAVAVRLLDTQARAHLGRRVLHQIGGGELTEDPVWRWSSTPDRYLDSALRLAAAADPGVRLVDTSSAPTLAVTLIAWHLEATGEPRLVAAAEVSFTGTDRAVRTELIRATEPVSAEMPGDLAGAAARIAHRIAVAALALVPGRAAKGT